MLKAMSIETMLGIICRHSFMIKHTEIINLILLMCFLPIQYSRYSEDNSDFPEKVEKLDRGTEALVSGNFIYNIHGKNTGVSYL